MPNNLAKIKQLVSGKVKVQILAIAFALEPVTLTTMILCFFRQVCGTRTYSLWIFRNQEGNLI